MAVTSDRRPLIRCLSVTKYFGGVKALEDVSLDLVAGQIVALVGDNGAGKSTLVKTLAGFYRPDRGELWFEDSRLQSFNPRQARALGVETVHQHLMLCENLGAAANVMLGSEPTRWQLGPIRVIDERQAEEVASHLLKRVGATLTDLNAPVRQLSGGQRQAVAIARALVSAHRLMMFDEPTAALGARQTQATLELIRSVAAQGVAALLISHNLDDVFAIAERIIALRQGRIVLDAPAEELTREAVVSAMTGVAVQR